MTHNRQVKLALTLSALAAALSLAACNKADDQRTAGQKLDSTVAQAENKADQMKSEGREIGADARQAADNMGDKVKDAAITTAVNAELAKAPNLSALRIDVDTANGRVALHGTAPTPEARDRATALAAGVSGVVSVDNQLVVAPKS